MSQSLAAQSEQLLDPNQVPGEKHIALTELLDKAVRDEVFPGAVLLLAKNSEVRFLRSVGERIDRAASEENLGSAALSVDTVFDLAELTRGIVTSSLLIQLVQNQRVKLEDKVSRYIQGFGVFGKGEITVAHLLAHTSGLPASIPFFEELSSLNSGSRAGILGSRAAKDLVFREINELKLKYQPGLKRVTSEVGFFVLGELIEALTGLNLEQAAQRSLFHPLKMNSSSFIDLSLIRRRGILPVQDMIAPTENCGWRKRILCGEVHDENTWAVGGVSGAAGLFSSVGDLHIFASEILKGLRGESKHFQSRLLRDWLLGEVATDVFPENESWAFGWDNPSRENGMEQSKLSPESIGLNGFTGCSLWIDPAKGLEIILLSNRIHPNRNNKKINQFRVELTDLAVESCQ